MNELFIAIRQMTADCRMISLNTCVKQFQVQQIKTKLFMCAKSQSKAICEWWLRLYHGEYSKKDLQALIKATEGKYWMIESEDFKNV